MDEKGDGETVEDIVAGRAINYVTTLSTDAASLSDSDTDDPGYPEDAEVDTLSPEQEVDMPVLLDGVKPHSILSSRQKTPVQPFHLKGISSTFSVRSQSIFDNLEETANLAVPCPVPEWKFKRPLPPGPLIRSTGDGPARQIGLAKSVPDYVAHPERWTKYSLEDVAEFSNQTNTLVAHDFLQDMRKRKMAEQVSVVLDNYTQTFNQDTSSTGRILFAKPSKSNVQREGEDGGLKELKNAKQVSGMEVPNMAAEWEEEEEKDDEDAKRQDEMDPAHPKDEGKDLKESGGAPALDKEPNREMGFHGNKKRIKKNIRARVDVAEDEDSS